jgi:hypothetical protein
MRRSIPSALQVRNAQRQIGLAMTASLGAWFAPVVSGVACNAIEQTLVTELLDTLTQDEGARDTLFWVHRKRMLAFNVATYAPWVGTSLQVLEVYSMGQFVIACARDRSLESLSDEPEVQKRWELIEKDILSGERVVRSYEEFSGQTFPVAIRKPFIGAVDTAAKAYTTAASIPGLQYAQEKVGEGMRQSIRWVRSKFDGRD